MIISDKSERYQIIWDLGRRQPIVVVIAHHIGTPGHQNTLTMMIWCGQWKEYTITWDDPTIQERPMKRKLSFTGGEPTVHPDFFPFLEWLLETYPEYSRGVTTNGFFKPNEQNNSKKWSTGGTISYHC